MNQRLLYFDNLKGFAILLVILGHCIQSSGIDGYYESIYKVIYSFHMPLFMAVSGYFGYKESVNIKTEATKKFRRLMLPFLIWGLGKIAIYGGHPMSLILNPDNYLWFLWDLFFISLLFSSTLALRLTKEKTFAILIVASILILVTGKFIPSNDYNIKSVCWMFHFYVAGALFRIYEGKFRAGIYVVLGLLLSFLLLIWIGETFLLPKSLLSYIFGLITAYVAVILCFVLFKKIANHNSLLMRIGQATLGIYAVHQEIISLIGISNVLLCFIVTTILSVLFVLAIRKTVFLRFIIGE